MKSKKPDALSVAGLHAATPPDLNERDEYQKIYERAYRRHALVACPFCERHNVYVPGIGQAVICCATRNGVAYMRSRCCPEGGPHQNGRFKLVIEEK